MRKLIIMLLVAAGVTALLAVAGCGGGKSTNGAGTAEVERMIRSQLPTSVRQNTGQAVYVSSILCLKKGGGEFDCSVGVTGSSGITNLNETPHLETVTIPVTASCDGSACTWKSG
jgi:hypothetical protein